MYIKRYTVAAFIWIALVGWYVYAYITQSNMGIDFFGIPLPSLSIALWVVLPLIVLYIASVFHMTIYSVLGSLRLRKYDKDYDKIVNQIVDTYLGKDNKHYTYKTKRYKLLGALLENSVIYPVGNTRGKINNEKIEKVVDAIEMIRRGEVVDIKPFNLPAGSELVVQNTRNRFLKGDMNAEEILINAKRYSEELCREVYLEFVKTASFSGVERYIEYINRDAINIVLSRINSGKHPLNIPNESIISMLEKIELTKDDYIKISMQLSKTGMIPEQRMKLFEILSEKHEEAIDAYLFTLYDLEMLAPADAILDNSQREEYQNFKAYRALKECGKAFSIDLFV